jgi:hypothetical protein
MKQWSAEKSRGIGTIFAGDRYWRQSENLHHSESVALGWQARDRKSLA